MALWNPSQPASGPGAPGGDPGTKNTVPAVPNPLIERNELAPGSVTRKAHQDMEWIAPATWYNAWAPYAGSGTTYPTVGYGMDNEGFVHMRGLVAGGAAATIAFYLEGQPADKFNTKFTYVHAAAWHNTGAAYTVAFVRIDQSLTGGAPSVTLFYIGGIGAWISLDGCTFDTRG